ncbi:branched-chain amino acid transport system substrate-binding protein [Amorphus suaedae]
MTKRHRLPAAILSTVLLAPLAAGGALAQSGDPIKIGDINSYSTMAAFAEPYRNGLTMAVDEINSAGGVLDRPLELITRDDGGKPENALRAANELALNEKVAVITGTFASNIGLAVAEYAKQAGIPFVASEALSDALTWEHGNNFTFRVRSSTYMQAAMLANVAATLPATRWAVIAPNYEFGHSVADSFMALLKEKKPEVEFVVEQYPTFGKIDAGAVAQVIARENPDAIFNATFGPDLVRLVREGNDRLLFEDKTVVSVLTGQPEFLDPLGAEAPEGWIVTGYPWDKIELAEHKRFVEAYQKAYGTYPRAGSLSGYVTANVVAAAIQKAGSTEPKAIIEALGDLKVDTPLGPITMRASDHQSTLGMFVGTIALEDGKGTMTDFEYVSGETVLPSDEDARALRPKD